MSAYDNPTIIKDDSAMAWAQVGTAFSDAFTQSFDKAKKERDIKEKEAKLDAERKEKDRKDQTLSRQIFYSKNTAEISEEASKNRSDFKQKKINQPIADQLVGFREKTQIKKGENILDATYNEVDKAKLTSDAQYASKVDTLWSSATTMAGAKASQVNAIYGGEIGKLNVGSIEYIGDNDITRLKNAIFPSKFSSNKNITSDLKYNIDNPDEGMKLDTRVDGMTKAELETYISGVNPKIIRDQGIDNFVKSNAESIEENGDGTYNIINSEEVTDGKSGEFYVIIPDPKKDTDLQTAGIYNDKDQLQDVFFEGPMYVNAQGNAGISKSESLVKVPKRLVKMKDIDTLIEKQVNTNVKGLLGSYLQDMNVLRGFMRLTGSGDTGVEDAKNLVTKGLDEQVSILSKPIMEGYRLDIMRNNNIRQDKDGNYYQLDETALKEFDVKEKETKISARDQGIIDKATALDERITRMENTKPGDIDTFEYNKKNIMYDGKTFRIEGGLLNGKPLSKEAAIKYLKTGK